MSAQRRLDLRIVPALSLVSSCGTAGPVKINEYADHPLRTVDRSSEPEFAMIGEQETKPLGKDKNGGDVVATGTGVLVSPCYVLTNARIDDLGNDLEKGRDYSMTFRVGVGRNAPFEGHVTATPGKWGNTFSIWDWALLRLDKCVGARPEIGWMEPCQKSLDSLISSRVAALGYSLTTKRGVLSISFGEVEGVVDEFLLNYSASIMPGMSGGPVIVEEDGELRLYGLNQGSTTPHGHHEKVSVYSGAYANSFFYVRPVIDGCRAE